MQQWESRGWGGCPEKSSPNEMVSIHIPKGSPIGELLSLLLWILRLKVQDFMQKIPVPSKSMERKNP